MILIRLSALVAAMFVAVTPAPAAFYDDYDAGIRAALRGQWAVVVEKMSAAITSQPGESSRKRTYGARFISYHPYYYRGVAYLNLGDFARATEDLERATGKGELDLGDISPLLARARGVTSTTPDPRPPSTSAPRPVPSLPAVTTTTRPSPQPSMPVPSVTPSVLPKAAPRTFLADQVLTASASIAFNAPEEVPLGERRVIQLLLDPREAIPALLAREITEPGRVESATIRISEEIEAKLQADAFDITPITPEQQALSAEARTEWRWQVQPREAGVHRLHLTINAILATSGQKRTLRVFDRDIRVVVASVPASPVAELEPESESPSWIALAVVLALLAASVYAFRRVGSNQKERDVSRDDTVKLDDASGGPLRPGQVLANRYEIQRPVGRGGMGMVYAARDREFGGELVALKTLLPQITGGERTLERFKREIQYARKVAHPNVCRIFDVGRDGSITFVTMEYVGGKTLSERLHTDGVFTEEDALPIIEQIASGLDETHRAGIIHRDLKTGNIMLADSARRAVLMDFGLASLASGQIESLTQTGAVVGSPMYMAPEQFEGGLLSEATDIYAFGTVIYEMLTGALPFEGDSPVSVIAKRLHEPPIPPSKRMPSISSVAEAVILKCLARDPKERYQSAGAVYRALV